MQINFVSIEISLQLFFLFCQNKNIMIEGILVLVYSMHRVSMKRKENSETYKGKNIFFFHRCGCDRKRKKKRIHRIYRKGKKDVELSKQVNAPAEIIWSAGRVLHINAPSHRHIAKKDKQLFCCRPCKETQNNNDDDI